MKSRISLVTLLSVTCLSSNLALAHHAISANYETDKVGTIDGVVVEVFWANPHVHYYLEVSKDDGTTELWDVESLNLSTLIRSGWTKETVEVGDHIRISGHLGRGGIRRLELDRDSLEIIT